MADYSYAYEPDTPEQIAATKRAQEELRLRELDDEQLALEYIRQNPGVRLGGMKEHILGEDIVRAYDYAVRLERAAGRLVLKRKVRWGDGSDSYGLYPPLDSTS